MANTVIFVGLSCALILRAYLLGRCSLCDKSLALMADVKLRLSRQLVRSDSPGFTSPFASPLAPSALCLCFYLSSYLSLSVSLYSSFFLFVSSSFFQLLPYSPLLSPPFSLFVPPPLLLSLFLSISLTLSHFFSFSHSPPQFLTIVGLYKS